MSQMRLWMELGLVGSSPEAHLARTQEWPNHNPNPKPNPKPNLAKQSACIAPYYRDTNVMERTAYI